MKVVIRRTLMAVAVGVVLLLVGAVVALSLSSVQRWLFERAVSAVTAGTGVDLRAEGIELRLLPGRLHLQDLRVTVDGHEVASIASLEARWSWLQLLSRPRRVRRIAVSGVDVDLRGLPPTAGGAGGGEIPPSAWTSVEIGDLEVVRGDVVAAPDDVLVKVQDIRVQAGLTGGEMDLSAAAERMLVTRDGRDLGLEGLDVQAVADASGLRIHSLRARGPDIDLAISGFAALSSEGPFDVQVDARARLEPVLAWWDPGLVQELAPQGRLALRGWARRRAGGDVEAHLEQSGPGFRLAGYGVESLDLDLGAGGLDVHAAGKGWGRAAVSVTSGSQIAVDATLAEARLGPALALALGARAQEVPGPALASGTVQAHLSFPIRVEDLGGEVDLRVTAPRSSFDLEASGTGRQWQVQRFAGSVPGAELTAAGTLGVRGEVSARADVTVEDPARAAAYLGEWWPPLGKTDVAGGPLVVHLEAAGTLDKPLLVLDLDWQRPAAMGFGAQRLELSGHMEEGRFAWRGSGELGGGAVARAEGATDLASLSTQGRWLVAAPSLGALQQAQPVPASVSVAGSAQGEGAFSWSREGWQARGDLALADLDVAGWEAASVKAGFSADASGVRVDRLAVRAYGGTLAGSASVSFAGSGSPIDVAVTWQEVEVASLPFAAPEELAGVLAGSLELGGTVSRPEGVLQVRWQGGRQAAVADLGQATLALQDGVLRLTTNHVETVGGAFILEGSAPLGDVPRPEWLWPEAPGGPIRLTLHASDLRSTPLLDAVNVQFPALKATMDRLDADLRLDPGDPAARRGEVVATGLTLESAMETVRSAEPLRLEIDGSRVTLQPFELKGAKSHLAMGGTYDAASDTIDGKVDATLGPDLARLLPVPIRMIKPIHVAVAMHGPLMNPTGTVTVDHPGGELVMRDPALKVSDLHLVATVDDGVVTIDDGSASVNRGRMLVGGGWDTRVGQGIVLELTNVYFLLPMNIITSWSGQIALEPDPHRLVKVVGDVYLQAGVWDHPVSLTSMLLSAQTPIAAPLDDPLREILLDLQVWGRGQIHVANNLGDFNVTWSVLHVGGSAADPLIRGVLRLTPGGTLNLPGQAITIRRAEVDFTGAPGTAPNVEIVPQQNIAAFGGGAQGTTSFNAAELATQTVARGIGSALGLENETLQPAEIGVETETNAASNFTVGQRLGRHAALFFSSNLSNVQDQTTMLQLWNFRGLPGLALQGYTTTQQNQDGFNVIERFRWGGSKGASQGATIQSITLQGKWPISTRRLKKATGLKKGEPYEPFLLFAAGLAMERELAGAGYQFALVDGEAKGSEALPQLVFTVDPGPRQVIRFAGAQPPRDVKQEVTSLYQPPPLEGASFDNMVATLRRYYASENHPDAEVTVARQGDEVVATIHRGPKVELSGPEMAGVPEDAQAAVRGLLSNETELANILHHPDVGERVVERLLANSGYPDAQVVRVWAEDEGPHARRVHLDVTLGERATVGKITLLGEDPLGVLEEAKTVGLEPGMPMDRGDIELAASRIRSRYVEKGYTEAQVQIHQEKIADHAYNLEVQLDPGARRTIADIEIQGLRHISRKVIRKGLVIEAGEVFEPAQLDSSVARIASFSPVESVEATTHPVGEDRTKVDLVVSEKPRWTAEVGAGWNSDRGSEFRLGLRDDDLFGRGVGLNLRGRYSTSEQLVLLYGSLPPLPGGKISFLGNVTYFNGQAPGTQENVRERRYTAAVEGDYQLGYRGTSARAYYQLSRTETTVDLPLVGPFTSTVREAILGAQIIQDELDNPFDPRRGYYAALDLSWNAPPLGSEVADVKSVLTSSWALAPWTDWTWTQSLRLGWATGLNGQTLTRDRAFFAGGQASIRGFDLDSVGPTTIGAGGGLAAAGGSALFILNNELRIPVWDGLRFAVFADVGQVWTDWGEAGRPFAVGAGVGLRWSTPVGPVWGDVAWPVADVGISSRGPKFYLGIGRPF